MRIVKAIVSLYRIVPYQEGQEPHADAVQVVEAVEAVVVRLFTDRDVDGLGFTYTIGRGGLLSNAYWRKNWCRW